MFDRIKKVFGKGVKDTSESSAVSSQMTAGGPVSEWAATQGFTFASKGSERHFSIQGKVSGKVWRMEVGRPSRNYIQGEELRGRAELGIDETAAVLVMNRPLKESLEKQAYSLYTDTLQTSGDPDLPEELRWLAIYKEVGWEALPREFWARYAVLADRRDNALAWMEPSLAFQLLEWPEPEPGADVPFLLMLLRGKAYLRMEYQPADMRTLQHAAEIFTSACRIAIGKLPAVKPPDHPATDAPGNPD